MSTIWLSAWKDLRRLARDPFALALWFGIPVFLALILRIVFGGGGNPSLQARLLVADEDTTFLSGMMSSVFSQGELGKLFVVEKTTAAEGHRRMDEGGASALLVIPKGFGHAVLWGEASELLLFTNPSERILPRLAEDVVRVSAEGAFYLRILLGDEFQAIDNAGASQSPSMPDASLLATAKAFQAAGQAVGKYLSPPRIDIRTIQPPAQPSFNFGEAMFPGMMLVGLLFVAQGMSADIWKERSQGTLRRLASSPAKMGALLLGKLASVMVIVLLFSIAGLMILPLMTGVTPHNVVVAALWSAVSGAMLYLMMLALQCLSSNPRTANLLTSFVLFPLMILGGSLFPFEAMPRGFAEIGRLTPNGMALTEFRALISGPADFTRLLSMTTLLVVISAALHFFTAWRIRRTVLL